MVRRDPGAATALQAAVARVRTDQRHRGHSLWTGIARRGRGRDAQRQDAVVLQQHRGARRGPPDDVAGLLVVRRHLGRVAVAVADTAPEAQGQQAIDGGVELGLRHLAGVERVTQVPTALHRRPGHLQVQSGAQGLDRAVAPEPVAHDDAVEAPLVAQDLGQQPVVVGAVRAVQPVVGAHDGPHAGPLHRRLERHQVHLAQRALVDLRRHRHPLELGLVADEVLDAGRNTLVLQPGDVGDRHLRRQHRILTVELEVAAADRRAVQVHGRRQQHMGVLRAGLAPESPADLVDEGRVPRGPEGRTTRERRRGRPGPRRPPGTGRSVGHPDGRDRGLVEGGGVPRVGAGEQRDLLFE